MGWVHEKNCTLVLPISETDLAYLAGLVDGEGCIYAYDRSGQGIKIGLTDHIAIDWLGDKFSGTVHTEGRRNHTRKPVKVWQLQRMSDLDVLLPLLIPFLKIKQQQAEILLKYIRLSINSKPNGKGSEAWNAYLQERKKIRSELIESRNVS